MVEEVIYVFYSYVFGLYVVSLTSITVEHNYGCHQKDSLCSEKLYLQSYLEILGSET